MKFKQLTVKNLTVQFITENGLIQPVDSVSFDIKRGEHVGLIGESGGGKTVTALSLLGFERGKPGIVAGKIQLNGKNLLPDWNKLFGENNNKEEVARWKQKKWHKWQRELDLLVSPYRGTVISIAFQDTAKMLDPLFSIGKQLTEAVKLSDYTKKWSKADLRKKACDWLRQLEMPDPDEVFSQYPHQLSGGMLQRVILAIALASKPGLLIADEPTTAIDVTVGSKILLLLKKLCEEEELTLLVISHDLAAISKLTQKVIVMYAGQIVEVLSSEAISEVLSSKAISSEQIKHPYTQALIDAQITDKMIKSRKKLRAIDGEVPKPEEIIAGCRFHPRCPLMEAKEKVGDDGFVNLCKKEPPNLPPVEGGELVRCWKFASQGRGDKNN